MFRFAVFGSGRIGSMHTEIIHRNPNAKVTWVFDIDTQRATQVANTVGAKVGSSIDEILAADDVDAVMIAAATNQHIELLLKSAAAGKAILCEKPIDVDLARVDACAAQLRQYDVPIHICLNRRFDPTHRAVQKAVSAGEIGKLELLVITSRDPAPPPKAYLEACGGLFRDMTIHDFDMARFILGEEPVEVFVAASNLVDPVFGELGDFDTAMITLRTASGTLCHINNSRRAIYGHDQRIEAHGARGMVRSENQRSLEVSRFDESGTDRRAPFKHFFIERYRDSYEAQVADFVECLRDRRAPSVTFEDGRRALVIAEAAIRSQRENRPISIAF